MDLLLNFVLFVLAAVGLSHILADSSLAGSFKFWLSYDGKDEDGELKERKLPWPLGWMRDNFVKMLDCYQCNGFWCGAAVALVAALEPLFPWLSLLLWGLAISLVSPLFGYLKLYAITLTAVDAGGDDEE